MPYKVKGNCVVKETDGSTVKCYTGGDAHDKAVKYAQALNINVKNSLVTESMVDPFGTDYVGQCADPIITGTVAGLEGNGPAGQVEDTMMGGDVKEYACRSCHAFVDGACLIVRGATSPDGHCKLYVNRQPVQEAVPPDGPIVEASLALTRASRNDQTGRMRWLAVTSNTERDAYWTRMSVSLYEDFIQRIQSGEPVPEQYRSSYWQGGMPYVSVAHFPDLNGNATVGMSEDVWVDGKLLKAEGYFGNEKNPELAQRAFEAAHKDLKDKGRTTNPIRVSIAFIDWEHSHLDGSVFTRKSLTEKCPMCERRVPIDEYTKGQLVHFALTRVPANKGTSFEVRSMTTQLEDAASIVGEDEAQRLQRLAEGDPTVKASTALVIKSAYEGVTSFKDALEIRAKASSKDPLDTVFTAVMDNLLINDEAKAAAIRAVVSEYMWAQMMDNQDQIMQALRSQHEPLTATPAVEPVPVTSEPIEGENTQTTTEVQTMPHPLDAQFEALRTAYDTALTANGTRQERLATVQKPLTDLGQMIVRGVDTAAPVSGDELRTLVATTVQEALQPIVTALAALQGGAQQPAQPQLSQSRPAPRQLQQPLVSQNPTPTDGVPSVIRTLARQSVGLQ